MYTIYCFPSFMLQGLLNFKLHSMPVCIDTYMYISILFFLTFVTNIIINFVADKTSVEKTLCGLSEPVGAVVLMSEHHKTFCERIHFVAIDVTD